MKWTSGVGPSLARGLPRTVLVLGVASFLTDISSEMIYPLLPAFLATVLGAGALSLGLIEGVAETTAALVKVYAGRLTDRTRRRKPLIVFGYGVSGLFRPLIGLAWAWPVVLLLRFGDRIGKGLRTAPRDALIAEVTSEDRRGQAFGLHRGMDHAGSVVGPLCAAFLLQSLGFDLRQVFLAAIVPALLTILVLVLGVREGPAPALPEPQRGEVPKVRSLAADWRGLNPRFKRLLACLLIFTLGNATDAFLLLRLTEAGVPQSWIGVLWSLLHIVKMTSTVLFGRLSDRLGHGRMLVAGWLVFALVYVGFALAQGREALIALFLFFGLFPGLTEPSERAIVAGVAGPELRGTAFGFYHLTVGLGALPASLLFGALWHAWGPGVAFGLGAMMALLAAAGLMLLNRPPTTHW